MPLTSTYPFVIRVRTHHRRSVPEIVHTASALFHGGNNRRGDEDQMPAPSATGTAISRPRLMGKAITISSHMSPDHEAQDVVERIMQQYRADGDGKRMSYSNMAVLYRRKMQSRPLEERLAFRRVPYVVMGGQPFWDYKVRQLPMPLTLGVVKSQLFREIIR